MTYIDMIQTIIDVIHAKHPGVSTQGITALMDSHLAILDASLAVIQAHIQKPSSGVPLTMSMISPDTSRRISRQFDGIGDELEQLIPLISPFCELRADPFVPASESQGNIYISSLIPIRYGATWLCRVSLIEIWTSVYRLCVRMCRVFAYTSATRSQWADARDLSLPPPCDVAEFAMCIRDLHKPGITVADVIEVVSKLSARWLSEHTHTKDLIQMQIDSVIGGVSSDGKTLCDGVLASIDTIRFPEHPPS